MVSEKRTRITISPTNEILEKIDDLAIKMGLSRSSVISFLVAQGLESYEVISKLPEEKLKIVIDALK